MPRRSTDASGKPFEVKAGLGFANFGGMYFLGDPSMNPPNRPRKLINVRLGEKDIKSRPGLDAKWDSTTSQPVIGMIEKLKGSGAGKIFWGPMHVYPATDGNLAGIRWLVTDLDPYEGGYHYGALSLDEFTPTLTNDGLQEFGTPDPDVPLMLYLPFRQKTWDGMTAPERVQLLGSAAPSVLHPVSHHAFFGYQIYEQTPPGPYTLISSRRYAAVAQQSLYADGAESFTHTHAREIVLTFGGIDYYGIFDGEDQWGPCLDPVIGFNGRWLAVASFVPVVWNPGAIPNVLPPSGIVGQQVFEVALDGGKATPPDNLVYLVNNPDPAASCEYSPKVLDNFFAGSLTELFRMPGLIYNRIPTRAAGGMDGKTIRSMCVRAIRSDNPVTAAEATRDKLYIGTHGGSPLQAASTRVRDAAWSDFIPPFHDPDNGEVYSFDETSVKLETTNLGPNVVVSTLPDGSILACGYRRAKLLDASDNTWKAVTYNPVPSVLPRYYDAQVVPPRAVAIPGFVDADWKRSGFIWTDRVIFDGTAYYVGYDEARLALFENPVAQPAGPPSLESLRPPTAPADEWYAGSPSMVFIGIDRYSTAGLGTPDAWVLYRFNRATMTMDRVRGGHEIYAALRPTYFAAGPPDGFTQILIAAGGVNTVGGVGAGGYLTSVPPSLAVFQNQLLYSWDLIVSRSALDPLYPIGIGVYNGATFDDDGAYYYEGRFNVPGVGFLHMYDRRPMDMLQTSRGVYVAVHNVGPYSGPSAPEYPHATLYLWNGTTLSKVWEYNPGHSTLPNIAAEGGRLFIGPT